MRSLVIFASVTATATLAHAGNHTAAVPPNQLPNACVRLSVVPEDARVMAPTLDAYTSVADCVVRERTRAIKLAPTRQAMEALNLAIQPALDLLDTAIEVGDLQHQIIAMHAKADLYQGLIVRVRSSAHGVPVADVDALVRPWSEAARHANAEVLKLAARDPNITNGNPVIASVVRDSRTQRAPGIASR